MSLNLTQRHIYESLKSSDRVIQVYCCWVFFFLVFRYTANLLLDSFFQGISKATLENRMSNQRNPRETVLCRFSCE